MELSPTQQSALARWNELGDTTPTHPVLQLAYELFLAPIGLKCDAMRYDALAALSALDDTFPVVLSPRWAASAVDTEWSQYAVIEPLIKLADEVTPVFSELGVITDFTVVNPSADPTNLTARAVAEFLDQKAPAIITLSENTFAAAKLYIDKTLELMIHPVAPSIDLAQEFLENPRRFAARAFQIFTAPPQKA